MNVFERKEWDDGQREFLRRNPELALKVGALLDHWDEKIETLKKAQRSNPMYWVNWYLGRLKIKCH